MSFTELEHVDNDAFFTENMILMCCGIYHNDTFYLTNIRLPPLHARKSFMFKVNENDYFGAYSKQKLMIGTANDTQSSSNKQTEAVKDNSIVVISQIELD